MEPLKRAFSVALLVVAGIAWTGPAGAAFLYKWQDAGGRLHITDEPPPEGIAPVEIIEQALSPDAGRQPPEKPSTGSDGSGEKEAQRQLRCRLIADSRRLAAQARNMETSERRRSEKVARRLVELRERTRFDEDEYDDFKDEIRELEEKARLMQLTARQADLLARQADLIGRMGESLVAGDCPEDY
jgi:hypothetical protein